MYTFAIKSFFILLVFSKYFVFFVICRKFYLFYYDRVLSIPFNIKYIIDLDINNLKNNFFILLIIANYLEVWSITYKIINYIHGFFVKNNLSKRNGLIKTLIFFLVLLFCFIFLLGLPLIFYKLSVIFLDFSNLTLKEKLHRYVLKLSDNCVEYNIYNYGSFKKLKFNPFFSKTKVNKPNNKFIYYSTRNFGAKRSPLILFKGREEANKALLASSKKIVDTPSSNNRDDASTSTGKNISLSKSLFYSENMKGSLVNLRNLRTKPLNYGGSHTGILISHPLIMKIQNDLNEYMYMNLTSNKVSASKNPDPTHTGLSDNQWIGKKSHIFLSTYKDKQEIVLNTKVNFSVLKLLTLNLKFSEYLRKNDSISVYSSYEKKFIEYETKTFHERFEYYGAMTRDNYSLYVENCVYLLGLNPKTKVFLLNVLDNGGKDENIIFMQKDMDDNW